MAIQIRPGVTRQEVFGKMQTVYDDITYITAAEMAAGGTKYVRQIPAEFGNVVDTTQPNNVIQRGIAVNHPGSSGVWQGHPTIMGEGGGEEPEWCVPCIAWLVAHLYSIIVLAVVSAVIIVVAVELNSMITVIYVKPQAKKLSVASDGTEMWQAPNGDIYTFDADGNIKDDIPYSEPIPEWVWYAAAGLAIVGVSGAVYLKYKDTGAGKAVRSMASSAGKLAGRGMTAVAKKAEEVVT